MKKLLKISSKSLAARRPLLLAISALVALVVFGSQSNVNAKVAACQITNSRITAAVLMHVNTPVLRLTADSDSQKYTAVATQISPTVGSSKKSTSISSKVSNVPALATSGSGTSSSVVPPIRYKTSPDPLSDAYSTTPPAPSPQDVNITITQNNQVSVGTLISYNSVKGDRTYYGGDYKFSAPELVIHKSVTLVSPPFTVSTPDGAAAEEPALPWYQSTQYYWPSTSTPDGPGTSWDMVMQVSSTIPVGTYSVHLTSFRLNDDGTNAWEYDGFITLDVEN